MANESNPVPASCSLPSLIELYGTEQKSKLPLEQALLALSGFRLPTLVRARSTGYLHWREKGRHKALSSAGTLSSYHPQTAYILGGNKVKL